MSPRGRRSTTRQIRAYTRGRQAHNRGKSTLSSQNTTMGRVTMITRGDLPKMGTFGLSQGATAPPPAPFGPDLVGWQIPSLLRRFHRYWVDSTYLKGSLLLPYGDQAHFHGPPSSPPIKGGSLLPLLNNMRQEHHRARARAPLHGLRP
jgi:hypothetical protein